MTTLIQNARAVEQRLRNQMDDVGFDDNIAADQIAALVTALEAAEKDAKRYRFARSADDFAVCEWFSHDTNAEEKAWWAIDDERLDTAMEATK